MRLASPLSNSAWKRVRRRETAIAVTAVPTHPICRGGVRPIRSPRKSIRQRCLTGSLAGRRSKRHGEKRLSGVDRLRVGEDGVPDYPRPSGVPRELVQHAELMMDMITLAMQTDSTRILSFMFTNAGSNRSYPEIGVTEGHHESSHHGKSEHKQQNAAKINRYQIDRFGYLLTRLKQVREGNRTLLDNSMIVYGSGISDGDRHNHDDLPILLAGSAGGRIQSGRHVRYKNGTPLCNLYLWMMRQMGAEADAFGDSTGVLPEIQG